VKKAYGYIRVSSPGQAKDDKDGIIRQEEAIKKYAKAHKLELVKIYREEGVSGTIEHRPALASMMVSLEQNGHDITTVVIERLDRLARDLMVQEAIIRDFHKNGFDIVSTVEGPDLCGNDATRKLIRQVMGAIAEYEKTMLVAKLWAAKERKRAKTGKYAGGRISYKSTDKGKELIKRIKTMRRRKRKGKRQTWQEIADQLNSEGLRTLDGKEWTLYRVQQISK